MKWTMDTKSIRASAVDVSKQNWSLRLRNKEVIVWIEQRTKCAGGGGEFEKKNKYCRSMCNVTASWSFTGSLVFFHVIYITGHFCCPKTTRDGRRARRTDRVPQGRTEEQRYGRRARGTDGRTDAYFSIDAWSHLESFLGNEEKTGEMGHNNYWQKLLSRKKLSSPIAN